MKNTKLKFFVDTTVAISTLTGRNDKSWLLFESGRRGVVSLFINMFVVKEIRRTMKELQISQEK